MSTELRKITIPTYLQNGGDGSAHVILCANEAEVTALAEADYEPLCEAEGSITIYMDDAGKVFLAEERKFHHFARAPEKNYFDPVTYKEVTQS